MNAPNPSLPKPATLSEAAHQFSPVHKPAEMLEKHKEAILLLRARGASYPAIAQMLMSYGVTIGDVTIARFCRQHDAEIRRLKIKDEHTDQDVSENKENAVNADHASSGQLTHPAAAASSLQQQTPPSFTPNKMRSLRGKV